MVGDLPSCDEHGMMNEQEPTEAELQQLNSENPKRGGWQKFVCPECGKTTYRSTTMKT